MNDEENRRNAWDRIPPYAKAAGIARPTKLAVPDLCGVAIGWRCGNDPVSGEIELGQEEGGDGESAYDGAGGGGQVYHHHADGGAGQAQGGDGAEKAQQSEDPVVVG